MRALLSSLPALAASLLSAVASPTPEMVAVLCNASIPESRKLAETYCNARRIPVEQIVALPMPASRDISREEYETTIAGPLREEFTRRNWWRLTRLAGGITSPESNKMRILAIMRGVPLRIKPTKAPPGNGNTAPSSPIGKDPTRDQDAASVDSELTVFGEPGTRTFGALVNRFHNSIVSITKVQLPSLILTARIDAASYATCERMIRDAAAAEKTGLWGMAYVDIANKHPDGDAWLEKVVMQNREAGIPTVVDRFSDTLPKHYPMNGASLYFGWYDWNVSGPFLRPGFRFRPGAVAMHLHSFSAEQLDNPSRNWSAALLERGAAATIGNVYEPFLVCTHDFATLHSRLLAGHTWIEACWMAMPVLSWQGIVLGDPLYRPFLHLAGTGTVTDDNRDFRALRAAVLKWPWPEANETRLLELDKAVQRIRSGVLAEAAGLELAEQRRSAEAIQRFRTAKSLYPDLSDKLRQDLHIIAFDRAAQRKDLAIRGLRDAETTYPGLPETEAARAWLRLLDPPPAGKP